MLLGSQRPTLLDQYTTKPHPLLPWASWAFNQTWRFQTALPPLLLWAVLCVCWILTSWSCTSMTSVTQWVLPGKGCRDRLLKCARCWSGVSATLAYMCAIYKMSSLLLCYLLYVHSTTHRLACACICVHMCVFWRD